MSQGTERSELVVLVALQFHNEWLNEVSSVISSPRAFSGIRSDLYQAMLDEAAVGRAFDFVTLADCLNKPMAPMLDLLLNVPQDYWYTAHQDVQKVKAHAQRIQEAFVLREVAAAAERGESAQVMLETMKQLAAKGEDRVYAADDLAALVNAELANADPRMPLPFHLLRMTTNGGLKPGELAIIAGRPGAGKSAMLSQLAWHAATNGRKVLFASAEMGAAALGTRLVSHLVGQEVSAGKTYDKDAAMAALSRITDSNLTILECSSISSLARSLEHLGSEVDCVVVDYLQKFNPRIRTRSEYERVSAVSRELDELAHQFNLPMVVACQFSRNADRQQPSMSDLRDSGQIEADADVIISLWQDKDKPSSGGREKVMIDVLKNRNGFTIINGAKEYALWFDKPKFTFYDITRVA